MEAYTLSYCVNSVLADLDETSKRHYQKFLHYAIQGYRRLNLGNLVNTSIKTAKIDIDSNTKTGALPNDYVDFLKVGYSCGGTIINLDYNTDIIGSVGSVFDEACDCQDTLNQCQQLALSGELQTGYGYPNLPWLNSYWYYSPYYHNGQYTSGYYGLGAGRMRNAYNINKEKCEIQFDSYIKADYVIIEYISNGIDCGDAYIDESLIPAITAYIHWKAVLHDTTKNRLETRMFEDMWKREVRGVMARAAALTAWDWRQIWHRSLVAIPKR